LPKAIRFKFCGHAGAVQHGVVAFLGFGRWNIADGREGPAVVEPVHPFEHVCSTAPKDSHGPRRWITSAL
jgi:hypothetical protein